METIEAIALTSELSVYEIRMTYDDVIKIPVSLNGTIIEPRLMMRLVFGAEVDPDYGAVTFMDLQRVYPQPRGRLGWISMMDDFGYLEDRRPVNLLQMHDNHKKLMEYISQTIPGVSDILAAEANRIQNIWQKRRRNQ